MKDLRSGERRRAAFFDRDGVINANPPRGDYITQKRDFLFLEPVFDWIRIFNALDYVVIVVTNQRCISLGQATRLEIDALHAWMRDQLLLRNCRIDDVYLCPHAEDGCNCRKPKPGMVLEAEQKWNLDLSNSILIGDSDLDRGLAENCGLRFLRAAAGRLIESC